MSVKLFVGFGGSGGKVLSQFARLVADDAELADKGDRSFYFLLVDTDQRDLEKSKNAIAREFRKVPGCRPVIKTLDLAANVDRMTDLVDGLIVNTVLRTARRDKYETDALKLAKKHWYFRAGALDEMEPFAARRLPKPLRDGAGQCPLAAHFAAWNKLGELSTVLNDIKGEMRNRENEGESVDLYMTGSLAGGTGRGCWQLLSLKAREIFSKCMPVGLFADASVFQAEVMEQDPSKAYRLHVNSLTGLSEIAGWLRNDMEAPSTRSSFQLPQLGSIGSGDFAIDTDRIVDRESVGRGRTPIDHLYIVTRASDSLQFRAIEDVYRMMGAALFAHTANESLQSRDANESHLGSVGVGIARVPIVEIRDCIVLGTREYAVQSLLSTDVTAVGQAVNEVCEPFAFEADEVAGGRPADIDDRSVLGVIRTKFKKKVDCSSVTGALESNESVKDVEALVEESQFADERATSVGDAIRDALIERMDAVDGVSPKVAFRKRLQTRLISAITSQASPGLGGASLILSKVKSRLHAHQLSLKDWASAKVPAKSELRGQLMDSIKEKSGRSVPLFGRRWDEGECKEVSDMMKSLAVQANFRLMMRNLHEVLSELLQVVNEFETVVAPPVEELLKLQSALSQEYLTMASKCFLSDDDSKYVEDTVKDWHSQDFKLERRLLPAGVESYRQKFKADALNSAAFKDARSKFLQRVADQLSTTEKLSQLDQRTTWGQAALEQVKTELLPRVAVSTERLLSEFRIVKVLESIEARVRSLLDKYVGDEAMVEKVQDYIESFFGRRFVLVKENGQTQARFERIPSKELLFRLAYSLARQTDPMIETDWRNQDGSNVLDRVTVYLPRQSADVSDDEWKVWLKEATDIRDDAQKLESGRRGILSTRNPRGVETYAVQDDLDTHFTIVSYAKHSISNFRLDAFDAVKSFNYWQNDPKLSEWLRRCEDGDHGSRDSSIWSDQDGNIGLGYLFPCFVTEEIWRNRRWAPWRESAVVNAGRAQALDALLYAMVGNVSEAMLSSGEAFIEDARKVVDAVNAVQPDQGRKQRWSMPLLVRSSTDNNLAWTLTRKAFRREDGGATVTASGGSWEAGAKFTTLRDLMKRFGLGGSGALTIEGQDFVSAVSEERRLLGGNVIGVINDVAGSTRRDHVNAALKTFLDEYLTEYLAKRSDEQQQFEGPFVKELRKRVDARHFRWDGEPKGLGG